LEPPEEPEPVEEPPHPAMKAIATVEMTSKGRGRITRRYQWAPPPQPRLRRASLGIG
jgi:hypothetical protein